MADLGALAAAIAELQSAEKTLGNVSHLRKEILDKLRELDELIASLPQIQLDLRMTRIRLQAMLPVQQPSAESQHDPDKTPVDPILRRKSEQFRAPDPKKPIG